MKFDTFKYFILDAMKSLKRNASITIFSVLTVAATLFIVGLFTLYLLSVNKNSSTIFINNKEMGTALRWLGTAVFIVLPIVSLFLIVNAIKMAVFLRMNEISIMKLVGATNWFIRWPFVIEGLVIGITGAIVGDLFLFCVYSIIYTYATEFSSELSLVQPVFIANTLLWPFGITGAFIGPIGSIIALRKALKSQSDKYAVWER